MKVISRLGWMVSFAFCITLTAPSAHASDPGNSLEQWSEPRPLRLPHPSLYGLTFSENSRAGKPSTIRLQAPALNAIDPSIDHIAITEHFDFSQVDSQGQPETRFSLVVEVCDVDCTTRQVLLEMHSAAPDTNIVASESVLDALSEDLALAKSSPRACAADPNMLADRSAKAAAPGMPGGPGFWNAIFCRGDAILETSYHVLLMGGFRKFERAVPRFRAACANHSTPTTIAACLSRVNGALAEILSAKARVLSAKFQLHLLALHSAEAGLIARELDLGWAAMPNIVNVAELARLKTQALALRDAADTQATQSLEHLSRAMHILDGDFFLSFAWGAAIALNERAINWHQNFRSLTWCFYSVVHWIANAAALGAAIRLWLLGGGAGPGGIDPPGEGPPIQTVLHYGPLNPRALEVARRNPIVVDIDAMPPQHQLLTRSVQQGVPDVTRVIHFGYDRPSREEVLQHDIWGPEPFTLLPMIIAARGTPLRNLLFVPVEVLHGDTDPSGDPPTPGLLCLTHGPRTPSYPYCSFGMPTTGTPAQIAAGVVFSRYVFISAYDGIVDPTTGEHLEPFSGYFVQLRKRAEGPSSPCYVWSSSAEQWVYDSRVPGCGDP